MPLVKKLTRIGSSTGVILDRALLKQVDLEADAEVEITVEGNRIVITPHRYANEAEFKRAARKVFGERRRLMERLAKR